MAMPFAWPLNWPPLLVGDWEKTAPPTLQAQTSSFLALYRQVTNMIHDHAKSHGWAEPERVFIDYLVAGFFEEYRDWQMKPTTGAYLKLFSSPSHLDALRVVAHAYLHIAYDLPRVLAQSFQDVRPPLIPIDAPARINRFLELQDGLKRVLDAAGSDTRIMGGLAHAIRLIPWRSHFLDVFGNWILVLRSNAFLHAEVLAADTRLRPTREQHLFVSVYKAAWKVRDEQWWNPVFWLSGLPSPGLTMLVPLGLFLQTQTIDAERVGVWQILAIALAMTASALLAGTWALMAGLTAFADALGREIQRNLSRGDLETRDFEPRPL